MVRYLVIQESLSRQPRGCALCSFYLPALTHIHTALHVTIQICTILTSHDTRRILHFLAYCAVCLTIHIRRAIDVPITFVLVLVVVRRKSNVLEPALLVLVYTPSVSFPSCHLLVLAVTRGIHVATGHAIDGA